MNVTLSVYKVGDRHLLTVLARPHLAATLGEFVLIEAQELDGLPSEPTATECLREAYIQVAELIHRRLGGD